MGEFAHVKSCPQQWGSRHLHYITFKIFIIDGLYSVIEKVEIMQQLCISKDFNL